MQILSEKVIASLVAVLPEGSLPQRDLLGPVRGAAVGVPREVVPRVARVPAHAHVRHRFTAAFLEAHWKGTETSSQSV